MARINIFRNHQSLTRLTSVFLVVACQWFSLPLQAGTTITMATAVERTLAHNPELQVFPLREKGLKGGAMTDALRPALEAGIEVENLAGSGDYRGTDSMDTTLSLSSVLELGNKREARIAVADARIDKLHAEQQATALDVSGEVSRRFIDALFAQERLQLARDAEKLVAESLQIIKQRADVGIGSDADVLRAQAALEQARLTTGNAAATAKSSRTLLAAMWGDADADFLSVGGNLLDVGSQESMETLYDRVRKNPSILTLASEVRLREAEVRLAQASAKQDVNWSTGIRQFNETNDTALVVGMSVPLFAGKRNAGALQAAQAAQDETALQQENTLVQFRSRVQSLYVQRQQALDETHVLKTKVIPTLENALKVTRSAFEQGRASYQEWLSTRQELLSAHLAMLDAAATAHRYRIDIEQLTAEPLLAERRGTSAATDK